jgi:hypothetical protein
MMAVRDEALYDTVTVTHRPRERSFIRIVFRDTPATGTEKTTFGLTERTTDRCPFRGDDAVTDGTITTGDGRGSIDGSGVGEGDGVGVAPGTGVGVGVGLGVGVGVGLGVALGPGLATRSSAAPTWRSP